MLSGFVPRSCQPGPSPPCPRHQCDQHLTGTPRGLIYSSHTQHTQGPHLPQRVSTRPFLRPTSHLLPASESRFFFRTLLRRATAGRGRALLSRPSHSESGAYRSVPPTDSTSPQQSSGDDSDSPSRFVTPGRALPSPPPAKYSSSVNPAACRCASVGAAAKGQAATRGRKQGSEMEENTTRQIGLGREVSSAGVN